VSKHRTQVERVIAAARSYRGVTQVDFLGPSVVDGKEPITRLAARLWDAEQEGYSFECIGKRDKCKIFRLCGEPDVERTSDTHPPSPAPTGDEDAGLIPRASAVAGSLDAGVERRGSSSGSSPEPGVISAPAAASLSPEPDRLFAAPPERTHHYEEAS
jgi:hypothetical protein